VDPWLADLTKKVRPALLLLIAASLCVLCVACANVANLLLARGTTRKKEISIRAALGAGRRRILRQLLTESLLLGVLGAVAALFVALAGTRAIVMLLPPDFPRLNEIAPDVRVLAFTGLLAIVTSCVFGFAPAWRVARSSIAHQLNDCSRGASETRYGRRLRSTVVAAEMTLAFVLVAGACFLLSGLWRLQNVALGFDPENLATVWMSLPDERDAQAPVRCAAFYEKFLSRVSSMPGVQSASAVHLLPLTVTQSEADFEIIGRPMLKADWPRTRTHAINNTGYFRTMGIPLLRGREFNADDRRDAPPVVIINETLARKHFPNQEPLGQHIRPGLTDSGDPLVREIVGVVGDVRSAGLAGEAKAEAYLPHAQCATGEMAIVMRSAVPLEKLAAGVRDMAATMEPSASVYDARLMSEYVEAAVAQPRLNSTLLAAFAVVALALSGIGVYSVMAYSVAQRRHEIGLRLALGAQKFAVFQLLLGDGARIATWALLAGGAATFAIVPTVSASRYWLS
jgi:putative ABC transport system permease protein